MIKIKRIIDFVDEKEMVLKREIAKLAKLLSKRIINYIIYLNLQSYVNTLCNYIHIYMRFDNVPKIILFEQ